MEIITKSLDETKKLAIKLAHKLKPKDVVALYGDLGSGKTTFTRFLVEALNINVRVQSPTFVLLRKYSAVNAGDTNQDINTVYHLDLYRLQNTSDLSELGLEELFEDKTALTIIEWPEIAQGLLPKETINIKFETLTDGTKRISL